MNKLTPEQALELVTQGLATVPTNKWADRVNFVVAVDALIAALQERQQLLDAKSAPAGAVRDIIKSSKPA